MQAETTGERWKSVSIVGDVLALLQGMSFLSSVDDLPGIVAKVDVLAKVSHCSVDEASAVVLTCERWTLGPIASTLAECVLVALNVVLVALNQLTIIIGTTQSVLTISVFASVFRQVLGCWLFYPCFLRVMERVPAYRARHKRA